MKLPIWKQDTAERGNQRRTGRELGRLEAKTGPDCGPEHPSTSKCYPCAGRGNDRGTTSFSSASHQGTSANSLDMATSPSEICPQNPLWQILDPPFHNGRRETPWRQLPRISIRNFAVGSLTALASNSKRLGDYKYSTHSLCLPRSLHPLHPPPLDTSISSRSNSHRTARLQTSSIWI